MNIEDPLHLGSKQASIIVKETTKENIVISQGRNSEGLHHKEYHSHLGIIIYFWVVVLHILTFDIVTGQISKC
jgi:hypothetical protein